MQMVAAAKMRKAQQLAVEVRPFARLLYAIQRIATTHAGDFTHALLARRPVKRRAIVLVASDKGLCGALNSHLFRLAGRYDPASSIFITAGRKASQFVSRTRRQLAADFPYGDTPRFTESRAIASLARDLFLKGEVDEVVIIASRFVNTLTQQPVVLDFLPVGDITTIEIPGVAKDASLPETNFVFEPNTGDVLDYLLRVYLNAVMHVIRSDHEITQANQPLDAKRTES